MRDRQKHIPQVGLRRYVDILQNQGVPQDRDRYNHPESTESQTVSLRLATLGNIEVQSAPHADDQGAEAKDQDAQRSSDLWLFNPEQHGPLGGGSLVRGVLHPLG